MGVSGLPRTVAFVTTPPPAAHFRPCNDPERTTQLTKIFRCLAFLVCMMTCSLPSAAAAATSTAPQDPGYLAAIQGYAFDGGNDVGPWGFDVYESTSYVAYRLAQEGLPFSDSYQGHWGNADHWLEAARKLQMATGTVPKPGSVAVWVQKNHVAFVDSVINGVATFGEYNAKYTYDPPRYTWDPPGYDYSTSLANPSGGRPTAYIYFELSVPPHTSTTWLTYLNTTVGRSCSTGIGNPNKQGSSRTTQTLTLVSKTATPSGIELVYQSVVVSTAPNVPPTRSTMTLKYLVALSGELDVVPLTITRNGVSYFVSGFEVYPQPLGTSPSKLNKTLSDVFVKIEGTTTQARKELGAVNGAVASISFMATISVPAGGITTPGGYFATGVNISAGGSSVAFATSTPGLSQALKTELTNAMVSMFNGDVVFGRGVGIVKTTHLGGSSLFEGCR